MGAPPATRSPSATWTARTVDSYGETSGVSIFIASRTTSGWRGCTRSPGATRTWITVPGIGAVTVEDSVPGAPGSSAAASTSGGGCGGGAGRLSRHAPRQGAGAVAAGAGERGGRSGRNAVVVRPAAKIGRAHA